ncbi:predicted protein [Nematostella vectensis]|uniref:Uncharacterized protein n=1 Tax=Nematostella vectensis TaxID=45351 RepID=A7S6L1_NEMVE|nr:protein CFAP107 isoform X1 [Nematostella vectensis]EDO40672.1 predicted protein [Nematostella vectensis]|eukprot:XP_001632735.1 predicted protein [Nematostella vectensis]
MPYNKDCKWTLPGWKIEPKYIDRVLIGNWFEERLQFPRDRSFGNSTQRQDFRNTKGRQPERILRRQLALRNWEGVGQQCLLNHHGNSYMTSGLSTHLTDYQHPMRVKSPGKRRWDGHQSSWKPEKLDRQVPESEKNRLLHRRNSTLPVIPTADMYSTETSSNFRTPTEIPQAIREPESVFKYRHRKSDVTPFSPVILRSNK